MRVPLRVKLAVMWSLNNRCSMLENEVSVEVVQLKAFLWIMAIPPPVL